MPFVYKILPGYFKETRDQYDEDVKEVEPRFGLLDDSEDCWGKFKAKIQELNRTSPEGTTYRVLFLGRHGQGYHNVGEETYGTEEWDRYWSLQNGDGKLTWGPDPQLTEIGMGQARVVNQAWKFELQRGIPLPESVYSSPLNRAIQTALISFNDILFDLDNGNNKRGLIKEKLREMIGEHVCDRRNSMSKIADTYPQFDIEPGFQEDDTLWTAEHRESEEELTDRLREAAEEIFSTDTATYMSITAHGGTLRALLRVLNRSSLCVLPTGGVTCVVVKVMES